MKYCSYCDKPFAEKLWCKKCDPWCIIEGWTSGNSDIDKFIKDTIFDERHMQDDGSWKKSVPEPLKVALKMLKGSRDLSAEYFNELKAHWDLWK
ncbi:14820_t:CDS:2, partial [Funneliformis mosseae]